MSRLVIFDADSMVFTVAYRFRDKKAKHLVTMNLNKYISDVIKNAGGTHYIGFYGSKEPGAIPNFRFNIYPEYKANRPPTPEWVKKWRPLLHNEMKTRWNFVPVDGMEADDAASVAANYFKDEYDEIVVATADKDLKQVPDTYYYNFQKHTMEFIPALEGHRHLAVQTLSGDSTDNIPGLPGIGPKKALNFVKDCKTRLDLQKAVLNAYRDTFNTLLTKLQNDNNIVTSEALREEYAAKGLNLSNKQLERKLKILNKGAGDEIYKAFPGGWKKFLRVNYALVRMLVDTKELPPSFNMPEPVESPYKLKNAKELNDLEAAKEEIFGDLTPVIPDSEAFVGLENSNTETKFSESTLKILDKKAETISKIEKINEKISEKIELVAPTKEVIVSITASSGDIMSL